MDAVKATVLLFQKKNQRSTQMLDASASGYAGKEVLPTLEEVTEDRVLHVLNTRFQPWAEHELKVHAPLEGKVFYAVKTCFVHRYTHLEVRFTPSDGQYIDPEMVDILRVYMLGEFTERVRSFYLETEFGKKMVENLCQSYGFDERTAKKVVLAETRPVNVRAALRSRLVTEYVWKVVPTVHVTACC
jgi:hypothetical protein